MVALFTGKGTSGSWQIRGVQLGGEVGVVKPNATLSDCLKADIIVVVKKARQETLDAIRKSGRPWVLDCVDFYPQPLCTGWDRDTSIRWVKSKIKELSPDGVIWPNARMMQDCGDGVVIYHHHRPDIEVNPIRPDVQAVAYEGSERYLGKWKPIIEAECEKRGWRFLINPESLSDADIVVAIRDDEFNGYAQRHWKSNVKLANAHGSGTAFIGPTENGYTETQSGLERWVDSPEMLKYRFDELSDFWVRIRARDAYLRKAITLKQCARQLSDYLDAVRDTHRGRVA